MRPPYLKFTLIAAVAFTAGLLTPSPFDKSEPKDAEADSQSGKSSATSRSQRTANSRNTTPSGAARSVDTSLPSSPQNLSLQVEVVEALIKSKGMERMLPHMGLSEDDVKSVIGIKTEAIKGLKKLEAKHAKLQSDAEGEFYVIEAFPGDRDVWMADITHELRDIIDDDRATVISRIIAQSDNDEETGLYRREVRTLKPSSPGGAVKIKESVFNEKGQLIDQDYRIYEGKHESRWEHLFEPEEE